MSPAIASGSIDPESEAGKAGIYGWMLVEPERVPRWRRMLSNTIFRVRYVGREKPGYKRVTLK